jgi:hypothetical protein
LRKNGACHTPVPKPANEIDFAKAATQPGQEKPRDRAWNFDTRSRFVRDADEE